MSLFWLLLCHLLQFGPLLLGHPVYYIHITAHKVLTTSKRSAAFIRIPVEIVTNCPAPSNGSDRRTFLSHRHIRNAPMQIARFIQFLLAAYYRLCPITVISYKHDMENNTFELCTNISSNICLKTNKRKHLRAAGFFFKKYTRWYLIIINRDYYQRCDIVI